VQTVRLGISTCPNDTFAFHALLAGEVEPRGVRLAIELADVEELNRRALAGALDVSKVSFHAALAMAGDVVVLPTGSALGRGVGPLVLTGGSARPVGSPEARVLCPGRWTTATLLWRLFHPTQPRVEQRVLSEIMPALRRGEADLGVCIHEGRFTWRQQGLGFVEDLGETWERETSAALPLGGIVARRALGRERIDAVQDAIARSLDWARAHRDACLASMRRHAQELDDDVLWSHVELYVNDETRELGSEGRAALAALAARAHERGLLPDGATTALEVHA